MRITNLEAFTIAMPFMAPIFSAYGVSYPARLRTFIRLHTDVGLVGLGETGFSALHHVDRNAHKLVFEQQIKPRLLGRNPFDYRQILQDLRYSAESLAVEVACWDLMGKAVDLPVYRLLGGHGPREAVPHAAYFFFRGADLQGEKVVTPDNAVQHVQWLIDTYGFQTVKLKLGVHPPEEEVAVVKAVRQAVGPHIKLRIDPNGCWSLPTAKRMLHQVADLDLEFVEEPIKYVPAPQSVSTQSGVPSLDSMGLAALRRSAATPIAADGVYRIDLLWQVARDQAADVVLGDIQGCGGIKGLDDFYTVARVLNLSPAMHSGTELGVLQAAKLHVAAARPEMTHAVDAIYHEYEDDVLLGGKLPYVNGAMPLPPGPGLGIELDEARLARYELTAERHRFYDERWAQIKADYHIPPPGPDLLVRHF